MAHAPGNPSRILIIRPSALGDVCRSVPVLASLKRAFPAAQIDWLVQDTFAPAIAHHPDLSRAILFPRKALEHWYLPPGLGRLSRLLRSLRAPKYEVVIDAQGLARSAFFARATGAPVRIGPADAREGAAWLYTHPVEIPEAVPHTVDRMLALLAPLGVPPVGSAALHPDPIDCEHWRNHPVLGGRRFAVLAPSSRWPGKRWPCDRFAAVAAALLDQRVLDALVVVGAAGERDQCGPLLQLAAGDPRIIDLVGRTSVGGLLALIASSALVIANDSAALHMAVGLGRSLVALYGPTDVSKVGPYGRSSDVLQHVEPGEAFNHKDEGLGRRFMDRISVDEVVAAAVARASTR